MSRGVFWGGGGNQEWNWVSQVQHTQHLDRENLRAGGRGNGWLVREADKSQGAVRQTDRQQSNEALWRDKSRQVAQCAPLAVTVDGPPLQVQGGLKHLQVMVLQDLAPCCVVLGPIWNLHQNTICLLIKKKIKNIKKT